MRSMKSRGGQRKGSGRKPTGRKPRLIRMREKNWKALKSAAKPKPVGAYLETVYE